MMRQPKYSSALKNHTASTEAKKSKMGRYLCKTNAYLALGKRSITY
jgi:hypothetical protein